MSRLRFWRRRDEVPAADLRRSNPVRFGVVLLLVIAIGVYFGFTKKVPFTHGYRLNAVFASAQNIGLKSPVRIAGVDVGQVVAVQRDGNAGIVTMEIEEAGLPIHKDATLKIRPRLFLEGNWFVELRPGSPSASSVQSGYTIPITQTADPVQLDQVLDALNTDTRANLQTFLQSYGEALTHKPTAAEDIGQDPEVHGLSGAEALKRAATYGPEATKGGAIVQQALGGVETHDISKLISGIGRFSAGLATHEQALGELVEHFDTFLGSFAAQSRSLSAAVGELPGALGSARRAFAALREASPSIKSFSNAIVPGLHQVSPTIDAAFPWIEQMQKLLRPQALGGVARSLSEASPSLAGIVGGSQEVFKQGDLFGRCLTKVFYPAGNEKLLDGAATTGVEAYKEFWYLMPGLAGIGQGFDGNGAAPRFLAGGGNTLISQPTSIVGVKSRPGSKLIAHAQLTPEGTSPAFPAQEPPYMPLVSCETQKPPNVNGALSHGPADGGGE